jgi:hypothetical protein
VADDLYGESVAQAEPSVCEIVNDEVASELVCALPIKHAVNDIQMYQCGITSFMRNIQSLRRRKRLVGD